MRAGCHIRKRGPGRSDNRHGESSLEIPRRLSLLGGASTGGPTRVPEVSDRLPVWTARSFVCSPLGRLSATLPTRPLSALCGGINSHPEGWLSRLHSSGLGRI